MSKRIACGLKALKELLLPPYKVEGGIKVAACSVLAGAVLVAAVLFRFWNIADSQCCAGPGCAAVSSAVHTRAVVSQSLLPHRLSQNG